jgi:hypothetical protein
MDYPFVATRAACRVPRASAALAAFGFACYNAVRYQFKNDE